MSDKKDINNLFSLPKYYYDYYTKSGKEMGFGGINKEKVDIISKFIVGSKY